MEGAQVEAVLGLGFLAQAGDDGVTDLVGAGLARPDAVAVDLAVRGVQRLGPGGRHVFDRPFAAPALGVDAGVDHQAHGPEQIGHQEANAAQRIGRIGVQIVGRHSLGVQRPAFVEGREAARAAPLRQLARLALQGDLQVMARRGLVIGQGRQGELRPVPAVAQVDVVGPRARAIQRRPLIVAARRARLDRHRHAAHLDVGLGQAAEDGGQFRFKRRDLFVQPLQQLFLARVGVGEQLGRVLVQGLNPFADRALGHALRLQDGVDLGGDLGHLFDAHGVDFLGREGCRRVRLQPGGVEGLAVRQAPHARVVHGLRPNRLQRLDLAGQGRFDLLVHQGGGARVIARQVQRPGLADQRLDHGHVGGGRVAQGADLRQHPVDDEVRRDHAQTGVFLDLVRLAVQHAGEGLQPRQEGVGAGRVLDAVLVVHEVGRREIGARQLGHDIRRRAARPRAIVEARRLSRRLAPEGGDGVVQRPGLGQALLVKRLQLVPAFDRLFAILADGVRAGLAELGRQARAGVLVQTQVGGALGRLVDVGLEPAVQQGVQGRVGVAGGGGGALGQHGRCGGGRSGAQQEIAAIDHSGTPPKRSRAAPGVAPHSRSMKDRRVRESGLRQTGVQAFMVRSSTVSGTPPRASPVSWKPLMSKRGPRRRLASSRSLTQVVWPTL